MDSVVNTLIDIIFDLRNKSLEHSEPNKDIEKKVFLLFKSCSIYNLFDFTGLFLSYGQDYRNITIIFFQLHNYLLRLSHFKNEFIHRFNVSLFSGARYYKKAGIKEGNSSTAE